MDMISQVSYSPLTVDLSGEKKREFWAAALGVSVAQLKTAVRATRSVDYFELKMYLDHKHHSTIN